MLEQCEVNPVRIRKPATQLDLAATVQDVDDPGIESALKDERELARRTCLYQNPARSSCTRHSIGAEPWHRDCVVTPIAEISLNVAAKPLVTRFARTRHDLAAKTCRRHMLVANRWIATYRAEVKEPWLQILQQADFDIFSARILIADCIENSAISQSYRYRMR
jgi:hypothetical protein